MADLSRLMGFYDYYYMYPIALIKRIIVLLAATLVFITGKDSYNPKDNKRMKIIFLILCCGEIAFLVERPIDAIILFSLCQFLLILRNGNGFKCKLIDADAKIRNKLKFLALIIGIILALCIIILYLLLKNNILFFITCFYAALLSISLWVGIVSNLLRLFPKTNAKLIAWGMICFYCSDIMVGMGMVTHGTFLGLVISSLIWVIYTPAIVFLALSGYLYQ